MPASVTSVSSVEGTETGSKNETATDGGLVVAVNATERLATMVDTFTKRIQKLEASHGSAERTPARGREERRNYTCRREVVSFRCNQRGHIVRDCRQAPARKLLTLGKSSRSCGSESINHGSACVNVALRRGVSKGLEVVVVSPLTSEAILGLDSLINFKAQLEFSKYQMLIEGKQAIPLHGRAAT